MVDINEHVQRLADGRWIVATWNGQTAQYLAPMTARERRLTGCHTLYARTVDGLRGGYIYRQRSSALRRARQLYGYDVEAGS